MAITAAAAAVLKEISTEVKAVSQSVDKYTKKVEDGELNTAMGVSFLEVKHQLLLSYLTNLTHLMYTKVSGGQLVDSPDIWRLVEIRTVLEKMRPIEQKLKYQIDKLVQVANKGSLDKNDPLSFKPNPQALVSKVEKSGSEHESEKEEEEQDSKPKLYVPPKLTAMHYDGDLTRKDRREKTLDQAKKRALNSSIIQDLREEYSEAPLEIQDDGYSSRKLRKELKERADYEEEHFIRLALSKKTKNELRTQHRHQSSLDKLTSFSDLSALEKDYDPEAGQRKRGTKRKAGGKGKKKKKKGRFGH